jgi:hypothetical protein
MLERGPPAAPGVALEAQRALDATSADEPDDNHDDGDDEQKVNEAAADVKREPEQPQHDENHNQAPK